VDRYIASVLQDSNQTRASLDADIARTGLTWKDYYERMREEVQRIQLINLLIRSRVNVPEEEVRRVWEEDPQFLESEKLDVAAIFLPLPLSGEEADKLRAQSAEVVEAARSNFEAAAKKYSKGPAAAEGGHLGEFRRGALAPQFEKGLQGLKPGQVSEPVEGPGGLYIVKLIGIKSSGRVPFDDVKKELGEKLYQKRLSERYEKWANEDLRKDHRIDNLVEGLALIAAADKASPLPPAAATLPGAPAMGVTPATDGVVAPTTPAAK
jgi:peptidyl-prolyl cis-trans isomerase SurA